MNLWGICKRNELRFSHLESLPNPWWLSSKLWKLLYRWNDQGPKVDQRRSNARWMDRESEGGRDGSQRTRTKVLESLKRNLTWKSTMSAKRVTWAAVWRLALALKMVRELSLELLNEFASSLVFQVAAKRRENIQRSESALNYIWLLLHLYLTHQKHCSIYLSNRSK